MTFPGPGAQIGGTGTSMGTGYLASAAAEGQPSQLPPVRWGRAGAAGVTERWRARVHPSPFGLRRRRTVRGGTWPAPGGASHCCSVDCSTAAAAGCFSRNTFRTSCGQRVLGPDRFQRCICLVYSISSARRVFA